MVLLQGFFTTWSVKQSMHYTYLSNASGKFVAPIITTPSFGLKLCGKQGENFFFLDTEITILSITTATDLTGPSKTCFHTTM